ncbi:hypothetical protein BC937DRAFT_92805, partial [Endogone sp. FLAS-F59071]
FFSLFPFPLSAIFLFSLPVLCNLYSTSFPITMSIPAFSLWSPSQQTLGKEATGPRAVNIIRPGAHPVQSPSAFSNSSASSYFTAITGSYGSPVVTPPAISPSPGRHKPRVAPAAQLDISGETARLIQSYSSSSSASNVSNRSGHARVAPTILNSTTITSALNNHPFNYSPPQRERERERSNSLLSKGAQRSDDGFHSDSSDRQSEESSSVLSNSNGNHPQDDGHSEDERSASPSLLAPTTDRTHPLNYNRASVIGAADDRVKYGPQRSESLNNNEPNKVVAKMRTGTILNGKGELVTMGAATKGQDEARVNRTIADLELQNNSLIAVNAMHEATIRKQATEIAELKKRLSNGGIRTDSPTSDLDDEAMELTEEEKEDDKFFKRICSVMDHLIDQAKAAVAYQPTFTGRVLNQYDDELTVTNNTVLPIIPTDDLEAVIDLDLDRDENDDDERLSTTSAESGAVTPRQATPIPHSKPATPKTTTPKTTQTPKVVTTKPRSTSTTRAKMPSPLSQAHKSGTPS